MWRSSIGIVSNALYLKNNLIRFFIAKIGFCQLMNNWNYKTENISKRDF